MDYENIKRKYPFLSEIDVENLCIISKCKINYSDIKKLNRKDLITFIKKYVNKVKKDNEKGISKNIEIKPYDIDVLFNFKKHNIKDLELKNILLKVSDTDVINYPNSRLILKKIKLNRFLNLFVMTICFITFCMSLMSFLSQINDNNKINKISGNINDKVVINEVKPDEESMQIISDDYFKYLNVSMLNVDFTNLKKENSDTKGWLKVEGTNVNYPFVQTSDNDYYLKHSFDKSSNKKGWVFLDYRNNIDNLNDNTIIYAHGLVNNAMFGSLRNTTKEKWYKKKNNRTIKVSTDNKMMLWEVFSTYNIEPESYYITNEITDDVERLEFYNTLKRRSVYDYDVTLNKDDKILTLSSCYDNTKRMVLHAKLIVIK